MKELLVLSVLVMAIAVAALIFALMGKKRSGSCSTSGIANKGINKCNSACSCE